jgi:hypothetical protein
MLIYVIAHVFVFGALFGASIERANRDLARYREKQAACA